MDKKAPNEDIFIQTTSFHSICDDIEQDRRWMIIDDSPELLEIGEWNKKKCPKMDFCHDVISVIT